MSQYVYGYRISFTRRRYGGRMTYTWASLDHEGVRISLGDPYPGVHWSRDALVAAVTHAIVMHQLPFGKDAS